MLRVSIRSNSNAERATTPLDARYLPTWSALAQSAINSLSRHCRAFARSQPSDRTTPSTRQAKRSRYVAFYIAMQRHNFQVDGRPIRHVRPRDQRTTEARSVTPDQVATARRGIAGRSLPSVEVRAGWILSSHHRSRGFQGARYLAFPAHHSSAPIPAIDSMGAWIKVMERPWQTPAHTTLYRLYIPDQQLT